MRAATQSRSVAIVVAALVALHLCGCGGSDEETDTSSPDGTDAADVADVSDTTDATDTTPDTTSYEVKSCVAVDGPAFTVERGVDGMQIHAAVAFDGETAWVAFNQPDPSGGFDGWVQRVNCDRTFASPPVRLHDTTDFNETDPSIAVTSDGALFAVWFRDTGMFPDNMEVFYRRFALDGTPAYDSMQLETTRNGMPNPGNETFATTVALPDGKTAITGLRANEAGLRFEAFVQRVAVDGSLDGEAIVGGAEMDDSDGSPTLAAEPNGDLTFGWIRNFVENMEVGPDLPRWVEIPAGAATPAAPPANPFTDIDEAAYLTFAHGPTRSYAVAVVGGDIVIADLADTSRRVVVGRAAAEHSPQVVFTDTGMALMYYRVRSGFQNDVIVQPFTDDGVDIDISAGEVMLTPFSAAAPYGPAMAHVQGDIVFLAWAEGASPNFEVKARFLDLAASF